ncbi:acyltransferase [Salmonella enterica subsp. enterica serovar Kirkee]|uniref:DNA injection protein n=1 Tax=Salmonella enterica I TaxID=59201 RepID=A0A379V321_SALET|nr:acyltransferase [Salmonella enterica subsp. enterica serovar Kirkee]EGA9156745.1 acyltransferase [Salmonella enterica subsp. enterica serovar Kirkee]SUG74635.1 DNA injection protein [Salmonella enterica subsp. enterica]
MSTWQEGNGGRFLAGIGSQNDNAPRSGDNSLALGLIRDNNDFARAGGNNIGLQALQGLSGIAGMYQQDQQQQAQNAFNQAHANAWSTGDNSGIIKFAQENPAFVAKAQQAVSGLDEQQRNELGQLAMQTNTALAQGPEVYSKFVTDNSDRLKRLGADPNWMLQTGISSPEQLSHLTTTMAYGAVGPDKMLEYQDKQVGRQLEQGRLDESARQANMQNDTTIRGQNISRENSIRSAYAPTAAMQNYNQYAQLLKSDPESAATFAAAAGINPSAKKLMKVETNPDGSVTKYYTDGSEEAGKINQPINGDGIKPISLPQAQSIIDKANEGSKKAAGFAMRLKDSMDSMNTLGETIDPKRVALINRALGDGTAANMSLSPAEQQYMVNARDALYSILRPETGAAITAEEMKEYSKMYLPQPGDSADATKTKMRKMQGQYNSLRGQSGRVYDALVVSTAANNQAQQPAQAQQQQQATQQPATHTSKSGIQFTVE